MQKLQSLIECPVLSWTLVYGLHKSRSKEYVVSLIVIVIWLHSIDHGGRVNVLSNPQQGQNVYELNHLIITFMNSQEILNTLSSINDRAAGIPRGREFQVKKKHWA